MDRWKHTAREKFKKCIGVSVFIPDCKYERKVLHKKAFPALRAYCESLGFQFYLVDLFWGLGVDAAPQAEDAAALTKLERDGLYQLAIKEIKLCQLTSMGPNFVVSASSTHTHTHMSSLLYAPHTHMGVMSLIIIHHSFFNNVNFCRHFWPSPMVTDHCAHT